MRRFLTLAAITTIASFAIACGQQPNTTEENAAILEEEEQATTPAPAPAQQPPPAYAQTAPAPAPAPQRMPSTTAPPPAMPAPQPAAPVATPPPAQMAMVQVPSGTVLEVSLLRNLSTSKNVPGDTFRVELTEPVTLGGQDVIPAGTKILGTVTESISAQKMKGQASLVLEFSEMTFPDGYVTQVDAMLSQKGKKMGKTAGGIIGGSAAGGALLGRIIGKDTKGAVKGALLGAAAGTAIAAAQEGQDIDLPKGTALALELSGPVQVPAGS